VKMNIIYLVYYIIVGLSDISGSVCNPKKMSSVSLILLSV
jgi:hypothetical protein